jgi:hypothetical protein
MRWKNRGGDLLCVFRGQDGTFVGGHFSGNPKHGGLTDLEMKVGGATIDDGGKELAEIGGGGHNGSW